jgi:hypothetical protein
MNYFCTLSETMKATEVKALDGCKIAVVFADGVSGIVDLSDLISKGFPAAKK